MLFAKHKRGLYDLLNNRLSTHIEHEDVLRRYGSGMSFQTF